MAWYDKYYNKICFNDGYYLEKKTGILRRAASKAIHPRNTHSVRWYEYYYEDEDGDIQDTVVFSDRFYRVTNKNRRLFKYYTRKSAEEEFPEYFI